MSEVTREEKIKAAETLGLIVPPPMGAMHVGFKADMQPMFWVDTPDIETAEQWHQAVSALLEIWYEMRG